MIAPDFLAIGHLTRDIVPGGWRIGGSAYYAGLVALRLGLRTAVLTRASNDVRPLALHLPGAEVVCLPSQESTCFENVYRDGEREQHVRAVADAIPLEALPDPWRSSGIVLLGPVAGELDVSWGAAFRRSLVGAGVQGWLRRVGEDGRVLSAGHERLEPLLSCVDAVFASDQDVEYPVAEGWAKKTAIVAYTRGREGAFIWRRGERLFVSAPSVQGVDPTGAGDAFAASFLIRWHETGDVLQAARFATACAGFVVEWEGGAGVPAREQIEKRLAGWDAVS